MLMQTSDLTGPALDWAVAKCAAKGVILASWFVGEDYKLAYSTDWSLGGPIIEREAIELEIYDRMTLQWTSMCFEGSTLFSAKGPTPLIAAMRCFVASRLGDEVDVPDELA